MMTRSFSLLKLCRPLRSNCAWHGLGNFVVGGNPKQEKCWNELKSHDDAVSNVIQSSNEPVESIDWKKWEDRIAHQEILKHMKSTYDRNMQLIDTIANSSAHLPHLDKGWELYEVAKSSCNEATAAANKLIDDGIRTLWISQNNPPAWKIDTNEVCYSFASKTLQWLESDQYWQAFVEKHAMYSQSGTSNDPEAPAQVEATKKEWNTKMAKFNERTDTPMLYDYMNHLPSWEFYDINRKQFYEHMEYFLLRTGDDFRHFPDIPPWKWLTHLEDLRYKAFVVAQTRKRKRQLEKVSRFEPTDLETGEDCNGSEINMQFLMHEKQSIEATLAYLMGNFMFLCDPLIPVTNKFQLGYILSKDGFQHHKQTQLVSLGDDVDALFVLPYTKVLHGCVSPLECFHAIMEHHRLSNLKINPSFATRMEIMAQVMQERGPNWLKTRNETAMEAFMRRMRSDDPLKEHFSEYISELQHRIANATPIPVDQWENALSKLSTTHQVHQTLDPHVTSKLQSLTPDEMHQLLETGHLIVKDPETGARILDPNQVLESLVKN
ncbi:ATP synthase [Babesia duncani]|uniref:ATP synthase n=1 Tax=Babesia duncani TaxID=323732 RepID=A0AAD9PM64_9APIC|nr:ATP synthase [Babesia duncani]